MRNYNGLDNVKLDPDDCLRITFDWRWPEESDTDSFVRIAQNINLTNNNIKIDVPSDGCAYIKDVYLMEDGGVIYGLQNDVVVFEITKRSKAFKELKQFVGHKSVGASIYKKQGNYGDYYHTILKFDVVVKE